MATYSPQSLGIKAPSGGFKQGEWYSGRQYWNGTLSDPNVIHPESNQQGAGQQVSREVIAQTNPANVSYLASQQKFQSVDKVQQHLNEVQNATFQSYQAPDEPKVQTLTEISKGLKDTSLLPTTAAPEAPKLVDTFTTLSEKKGLDNLQKDINDLKVQEDTALAQLRTKVASEQGKPVAQNVIEGRISEQERTAREKLDFIQRQKARKVDEYNTALTNVKMIMDFTQKDYDNALQSYDTQFKQAISVINLVHGIQQDQKNEIEKARDNARANAQIMVNALKEGNIDVNNMPADMKAQLNKLEVQSGLPVGFFSSIRKDPKADIVATSSDSGQIQVLMRNPNGSMSLQTYGQKTYKPTEADQKRTAIADMERTLSELGGADGIVSPQEWNEARQVWIRAGYTSKDFDEAFASQHVNWGHETGNYRLDQSFKPSY